MNCLWVRLSLMISGVLFLMFFLQFLNITLEQSNQKPDLDGPHGCAARRNTAAACWSLWHFPLWSARRAEFVIGWVTSAPITRIAQSRPTSRQR